jgi:hypothetical protein
VADTGSRFQPPLGLVIPSDAGGQGAGTDSRLESTFNLSRPVSSLVVSSLA